MGEGWRRCFPAGKLDPRPDLHRHQAESFADALERLEEPPLHPARQAGQARHHPH